ncbi:prolyl oligopeptidase family serine peptidase [Haloechinothrix sp. LS1_15]|uniref:S9 family peptidase n=1 Tax=Haloechinothrix sp. LS1_15 TaxID=2652248 RepID=UPI00294655BE|nr:prolyl oligopeptidase family serine peptidase [Haloechinothrix sp. LS1_15]MDV6013356.1 prolyl oligopeptidase family serine peptidase [Haloechinothrix sp. LS1_15]
MPEDVSFARKLARTQRFTLGIPREFRVASDGSRVLFLRSEHGESKRQDLWSLETATGQEHRLVDAARLHAGDEEELPEEERARRERSRETGGGVVGYAVDQRCTVAAFTLAGRLYTVEIATGEVTERARPDRGAIVDPRPNPQGTHVAYACSGTLRVIELATGEDTELVAEEDPEISWGVAEFIAAEEMGRSRGYWWSQDGAWLLVQRSDSSGVPRWTIADPAHPDAGARSVAYPAAGATNVAVSLALIGLDGTRIPVDAGDGWEYLASVHWSAGGPPLVTVQTRDQRMLDVLTVDTTDGTTTLLHRDTDPDWVELAGGVPAWTTDGRLVRIGVADGAYRLMIDGKPVTDPGTQVRSVLAVDAEVLFTASEADPTQIHVYRTERGSVRRLSTDDGMHSGAGASAVTVLTSWSPHRSGPVVTVLRGDGTRVPVASHPAEPGVEPKPQLHTTGRHELRSAVLFPTGYHPDQGRLPVLLDPYGGPHAQRVLSTRNAFLSPQWFADQGFAVVITDGRGTPGRGPVWEKAVSRSLAEVTLDDQVDALHELAQRHPELDTGRVAIRGWSYGGYLAALAVLRRPDVFHAAIAGAPVVDWSLYDTHYTERYLGHPEAEPGSYRDNSLLGDAAGLRRPLLIVHGLADDNVFVAHALRLSAALLAAGKQHTFLPLVATTHMTPQDEGVAEQLLRLQLDWLRRELPDPVG